MKLIRKALCTLVLALLATLPAQAGKRVALVMGNSAYINTTALPNPRNDAEDMAAVLEKLGFEVIRGMDLDREGMEAAVDRFGAAADGADLALVFYAGHGIQVAGENYALPIDAQLRSERDLRRAVPLSWLVDEAGRAAQLGLVILDACRNNPLAEEMKRGIGATRAFVVGRGLARLEDAPTNTLIAYATSADATADDGSGRNSPYTRALLQHIPTPGLEIRQLFGRVRDSVMETTNSVQIPFTYGSLGGDAIYLALPLTTVSLVPGPGQSQESEKYVTSSGRQLVEIEFWRTIKDSADWRDFQAYLDQFGEGATFSVLARLRRDKLRGTGDTDIHTAINATPLPGTPHAEYPDVVWNADGKLEPASGYEWVSDDPDNYNVVLGAGQPGTDIASAPSTETTTTATDASGAPAAGAPHDTYPNVVWGAYGLLEPALGYEWGSDDPSDFTVRPATGSEVAAVPDGDAGTTPTGTPHAEYPNVVWNDEGLLDPAPGYEWASEDPDEYGVRPESRTQSGPPAGTPHETYPNVVWNDEGLLDPAPGFSWTNDDPDSYDVVRVVPGTPHATYPNVVWDEDGQLQPASGYQWVSDDSDSYEVQAIYPGARHYKYPNVVWDNNGKLEPAPGYNWLTDDPDNYEVVPNSGEIQPSTGGRSARLALLEEEVTTSERQVGALTSATWQSAPSAAQPAMGVYSAQSLHDRA
jgi:hypothetical protein